MITIYNRMNKYGIVYIIKCKDENIKNCYVGSAGNFKHEKCEHKSCKHKSYCNNPFFRDMLSYNPKIYQFIRLNGGFENFYFEILQDEIEYNKRIELDTIERYHIENIGFNLCLNSYDSQYIDGGWF